MKKLSPDDFFTFTFVLFILLTPLNHARRTFFDFNTFDINKNNDNNDDVVDDDDDDNEINRKLKYVFRLP